MRLVEELHISALSEQLNQDDKHIRNVNNIRCFRNCTYKLRDEQAAEHTKQKADYIDEIVIRELSKLPAKLEYNVSVVEPRLLGHIPSEPVFL